jgi:hypothetical protein
MANAIKKWEVQRRLEEIERRLYWAGSVGRADLIKLFGISPQQASTDLKTYLTQAGETVRFDGSSKSYRPTSEFSPFLIKPSIEDYTSWIGEIGHPLAVVPIPFRTIPADVLRGLAQAIQQGVSINIQYRSLTNPQGMIRRISPHSIVATSTRYHVRAYCHTRLDFRDFVLGRIIKATEPGLKGMDKSDDGAWNTLVIARIGPHSKLSAPMREIIEADFAMEKGEAQIKIRQALLFYFLDQFNLDGNEQERSAVKQQIVLLNQEIRSLVL